MLGSSIYDYIRENRSNIVSMLSSDDKRYNIVMRDDGTYLLYYLVPDGRFNKSFLVSEISPDDRIINSDIDSGLLQLVRDYRLTQLGISEI